MDSESRRCEKLNRRKVAAGPEQRRHDMRAALQVQHLYHSASRHDHWPLRIVGQANAARMPDAAGVRRCRSRRSRWSSICSVRLMARTLASSERTCLPDRRGGLPDPGCATSKLVSAPHAAPGRVWVARSRRWLIQAFDVKSFCGRPVGPFRASPEAVRRTNPSVPWGGSGAADYGAQVPA